MQNMSKKNEKIASAAVGLLWRNARLADAFASQKKGWDIAVSEALSVTPAELNGAVKALGFEAMKEQVANNPAGKMAAPARPGATLRADSNGCPLDSHYCPSGSGGGCCGRPTFSGCVGLPKFKL